MGTDQLPSAWFDAIALLAEDARELEWRTNADRMEAAIRNRLGFGGKA